MKYIKKYENNNNINYLVVKLINSKPEFLGFVHLLRVFARDLNWHNAYGVYPIEPESGRKFTLYEMTETKYSTEYGFVYEILYSSDDYESAFEKYNLYSDAENFNI